MTCARIPDGTGEVAVQAAVEEVHIADLTADDPADLEIERGHGHRRLNLHRSVVDGALAEERRIVRSDVGEERGEEEISARRELANRQRKMVGNARQRIGRAIEVLRSLTPYPCSIVVDERAGHAERSEVVRAARGREHDVRVGIGRVEGHGVDPLLAGRTR